MIDSQQIVTQRGKLSWTTSTRLFFSEHRGIGKAINWLIGPALALILFLAAREKPALTYLVSSTKAAVVRRGVTTRLNTGFDGAPLDGDVTAVQIAFWNNGKKAIRSEDILKPLVFGIPYEIEGARILEAYLRSTTRSVTGLELDTSEDLGHRVEVHWKVLEKDDGGVLQLIYEGDERVPIFTEGVFVGQAHVLDADTTPHFLRTNRNRLEVLRQSFLRSAPYVFIALGILLTGLVFSMRLAAKRSGQRMPLLLLLAVIATFMVTMALGIGALLATPIRPPFPF